MMVIVAQSSPPLFFVFLYGRTACDELAAVGRGDDTAAGGAEPLAVHGGGGAANCPPVGNRTKHAENNVRAIRRGIAS